MQQSAGFLINKLAHSMMIQLEKRIKPYSVTTSQWAILALLWKNEGAAQIDLQRSLGLDKATVTGLLQRMNASGLIERQLFIDNGGRLIP